MNLAHSSNNAMPKGGKIGQKQSVLKRSCRKKIPKFKGVQKQKKLPVEVARNSATEITFVGEDDIVSEQIPPPAASASLLNLNGVIVRATSLLAMLLCVTLVK